MYAFDIPDSGKKKIPCLMHQYLLDASILVILLMHQQYLGREIDASTIPWPRD
jgi:hypothetical protein